MTEDKVIKVEGKIFIDGEEFCKYFTMDKNDSDDLIMKCIQRFCWGLNQRITIELNKKCNRNIKDGRFIV